MPAPLLLAAVAVRTTLVLIVLVLGVRLLTGRHTTGDLNMHDIVTLLMVANAVQNAMTEAKGDLTIALASSAALLVFGWGLAVVMAKWPPVEERLLGSPVVIVRNARPLSGAMRREGVTQEELGAAIRERGLRDVGQVKLAILEADGSISVIPKTGQE